MHFVHTVRGIMRLLDLPVEIHLLIFEHLYYISFCSLSSTCKTFNAILGSCWPVQPKDLKKAVQSNDVRKVKFAVSKQLPDNVLDKALIEASGNGFLPMIRGILALEPYVSRSNALEAAVKSQRTEVVAFFVQEDVIPKWRPLHVPFKVPTTTAIMRLLIKYKPDAIDYLTTALEELVLDGHIEVVESHLQTGLMPLHNGMLKTAKYHQNSKMVELLQRHLTHMAEKQRQQCQTLFQRYD
ncbi:hypothetical protein BDV06DRAFT_206859 [Aspergillus oleicola]